MIGYVTLGTNDLPRAARFYDAIAGELGVPRFMQADNHIAWGVAGGGPGVAVTKPFDGNAASVGNGVMVALYFVYVFTHIFHRVKCTVQRSLLSHILSVFG